MRNWYYFSYLNDLSSSFSKCGQILWNFPFQSRLWVKKKWGQIMPLVIETVKCLERWWCLWSTRWNVWGLFRPLQNARSNVDGAFLKVWYKRNLRHFSLCEGVDFITIWEVVIFVEQNRFNSNNLSKSTNNSITSLAWGCMVEFRQCMNHTFQFELT